MARSAKRDDARDDATACCTPNTGLVPGRGNGWLSAIAMRSIPAGPLYLKRCHDTYDTC